MKFTSAWMRILFLLGALFLGGTLVWTGYRTTVPADAGAPLTSDGFLRPAEAQRYWSGRIAKVGGEDAYQEFLSTYRPTSYETQHAAAHLMGHTLYQELGIGGLPICDSSFSFGCYHQFFTDALTDKGIGIVTELDKACLEKFGAFGTGCQHGIGHGLGEYFGYSDDALLAELAACDRTTEVNEYFGCTSGVFMQYNEPINLEGASVVTNLRTLNTQDPYMPCDTIVPDPYKKSCYFALPQWWMSLGTTYATVGAWCASAPDGFSESCLLGVGGVIAPRETYDVERTVAGCLLMPDTHARILCRASASWALFAMPDRRKDAAKVCAGLSPEDRKLCAQKSDLIGNGEIFQAGEEARP